jgi:hypothetical protein
MATMDQKCKIYTLSHPITGEIRYVGQTTLSLRLRHQFHMSESRQPIHTKKLNWIRSISKLGLEPKIELIEEGQWNESEMYWIEQFKAWGFQLVNSTVGGDGVLGRKVSENTRQKMSIAMTGKKASLAVRKKLSKAHAGVPRPQRRKGFKLIDESGNETVLFGSVQVSEFIGCERSGIYAVIKKKRNSIFGYKIEKL